MTRPLAKYTIGVDDPDRKHDRDARIWGVVMIGGFDFIVEKLTYDEAMDECDYLNSEWRIHNNIL